MPTKNVDPICQCPQCETKFKITSEQLDTSHKQVRCGNCFNVFIATKHFVNKDTLSINPATKELNSINYFMPPTTKKLHTSEFIKAKKLPKSKFVFYKNKTKIMLALATVTSVALLSVQIGIHPPGSIELSSDSNRITQLLCTYLPCQTKISRAPEQLRVLEKNLFANPTQKNSLRFAAIIKNTAPFDQPYAPMLMRFLDINGKTIFSRVIEPDEYLNIDNSNQILASNEQAEIQLDLEDPGQTAVGYAISFH